VERTHSKEICKRQRVFSPTRIRYESLNTFNAPPAREEGQFSGKWPLVFALWVCFNGEADSADTEATQQAQQEMLARGGRTAENIRYSEAISEHGFGGETKNIAGSAEQEGYGRAEALEETSDPAQTRREQGYGKGPEVGA
jgi:hypothetical protein